MTAKRAIWTFRVLVYGSAALVALLLLLHRGGDAPAPTAVTVAGMTSQGKHFNASFRDGRAFRMHTDLIAHCPGGTTYLWYWTPKLGFVTDGERVRVSETAPWHNDWSVTEHLRLDARYRDGRLTGTLESVVDVTVPFRGTCRSGPVRITAE